MQECFNIRLKDKNELKDLLKLLTLPLSLLMCQIKLIESNNTLL